MSNNSNFNEEIQVKIKPSINQKASKGFIMIYGYVDNQGFFKPYMADPSGNNIDLTTGADTAVWDLKYVLRTPDPIPNGVLLKNKNKTQKWYATEISQVEGQSTLTLMSQKAISDALDEIRRVRLKVEFVDELPIEGVENVMYFVPSTNPNTPDTYDEYMWVEDPVGSGNYGWHLLGNTGIDLSNYYTKPEVNDLLDTKQDKLLGFPLNILPSVTNRAFTTPLASDEVFKKITVMLSCDDANLGEFYQSLTINIFKRTDGGFDSFIRTEGAESSDMGVSFNVDNTTGACTYTSTDLTDKLLVCRYSLFSFSTSSGSGGGGSVASVAGVLPDSTGDVPLIAADIDAVSETDFETYKTAIELSLEDLADKNNEQDLRLDSLETRATDSESDIVDINTNLETVSQVLTSYNTRITNNEDAIATNESAISGINTVLTQHDEWFELDEADIASLKADMLLKFNKSDVVQTSGMSTTQVMSQKATTDYVNSKVGTTYRFVDTLPAVGESGYIYVIDDPAHGGEQWQYTWDADTSTYEDRGAFGVNLDDYYDKTTVDTLLSGKANVTDLTATNNAVTSLTGRVSASETNITNLGSGLSTAQSDITNLQTTKINKADAVDTATSGQNLVSKNFTSPPTSSLAATTNNQLVRKQEMDAQDALDEKIANKASVVSTSTTQYPTSNAVKTYVDGLDVLCEKITNKVTTVRPVTTATDTNYPSELAVRNQIDPLVAKDLSQDDSIANLLKLSTAGLIRQDSMISLENPMSFTWSGPHGYLGYNSSFGGTIFNTAAANHVWWASRILLLAVPRQSMVDAGMVTGVGTNSAYVGINMPAVGTEIPRWNSSVTVTVDAYGIPLQSLGDTLCWLPTSSSTGTFTILNYTDPVTGTPRLPSNAIIVAQRPFGTYTGYGLHTPWKFYNPIFNIPIKANAIAGFPNLTVNFGPYGGSSGEYGNDVAMEFDIHRREVTFRGLIKAQAQYWINGAIIIENIPQWLKPPYIKVLTADLNSQEILATDYYDSVRLNWNSSSSTSAVHSISVQRNGIAPIGTSNLYLQIEGLKVPLW